MSETEERPTRGALEAQVGNAIVQFERVQHGRGPSDARAHIIGDMVVVRCTGIFTQTEAKLSSTEEGRRLIRSARHEIWSINCEEVERLVGSIVGTTVLRSYCDGNPGAAEQMAVFVLAQSAETLYRTSERERRRTLSPLE